jgi:hypothetical protein
MGIERKVKDKIEPARTLQFVEPAEINRRMTAGDTFVVNVVTAWCPDCTKRQALHIDGFADTMQTHGVDVLQINVQQQRGEFIGPEYERVTTLFGGHVYPRTVLINHGKVADHDNVEVMTEDALLQLAQQFGQIITQS